MNPLISTISPYLFWDIDVDTLDPELHSAQIIQRVLEYGQLNDWLMVRDYYTLDRVVSDCKKLRTLQPAALTFICAISHTNKEDYRCFHYRQSVQTPWNS